MLSSCLFGMTITKAACEGGLYFFGEGCNRALIPARLLKNELRIRRLLNE